MLKSDARISRSKAPSVTYACDQLKASCGCSGENVILNRARIVGGEEAVPFSWTMSVSIRLNDTTDHACGGSILSASYILTSALCVDGAVPNDISIAAGIHNLEEDFLALRFVQEVYIHPDWNRSDGSYRHDIALLRIFPPLNVDANGFLARTCVPYLSSPDERVNYPREGSDVTVVGWGATEYGRRGTSVTLQQATVSVIDNNASICQHSVHDVKSQFCADMPGKGNPRIFGCVPWTQTSLCLPLDPCLGKW